MEESPLSDPLLERLRCPETGQRLRLATPDEIEQAKANHGLEEPAPDFRTALVREDGKRLFPVIEGLPVMLKEQGLPLP